ncbi:MAG: HD domain-containing protein [Eubacterium sp.]|nr:HD domain-containing protein [Eubacterium sp.]
MYYINELREGDNVSAIYFCKTKIVATTKAGKTYYNLMLQDRTGVIDGKVWDLSNGIDHFEELDYIAIDGQVTSFNNQLQLNIRRIRKAREGEYDVSEYMPVSPYKLEEMEDALMGIISRVENPHLHALLSSFFLEDESFLANFRKHSAAKSVHHSFIGGLLHHSLFVARTCEFLAKQYPMLNKDLLVTAAILHDVGKLKEISDFPENDYTDAGQLLGHIVIGAMWVNERIEKIPGFPEKLKDELLHCILAHHGELEFGSPKKPAIIEALALSFADNLDAKMETFTELLKANENISGWLGFNRLLDSNVKKTES